MPRWPWPPSSSPEYPPSAERNGAPRHSRWHSRPAEAPRIAAACPADLAEAGPHCAPATLPERPGTARVADKVGNGARTSPRSRRTEGTWSPCPETTAVPAQSPGRSSLSPAPVLPVQSSPQSAPLNTSDVAIGGDVSLIRRWPTFARRSPPQVADFCTPLHTLRATHPGVGAERQSRADRQLPRPQDHPATGPGTGHSVLHPDRGNLHQASLRQFLDQDVQQGRLRAAHRNHDQRRVLFQAPPQGGTSPGTAHARPRPRQENHLQPDRPARDPARLQSALPVASLRPRRLLRRRSCSRQTHQTTIDRRQDRQGHQLLRSDRRCLAARLAKPAGQYRRHPTGRPPAARQRLLPSASLKTTAPPARHRRHQARRPNLSLLPHTHGPRCDRSALPRHTKRHHPSPRLTKNLRRKRQESGDKRLNPTTNYAE